jgi:hypothetical protein
MTDWKDTLANFFNERGINKKLPEVEAKKVNSFIQNVIYPAFEKLTIELNSYDIPAVVFPPEKNQADVGRIMLVIKGADKPVLNYRPKFSITENIIYMSAQIKGLNIYEEKNTLINAPLNEIDETIIINDFIQAYSANVKIIDRV